MIKRFEDYNPIVVFVFYFCVILPIMFSNNPILTGIAAISGLLYLLFKDGFKRLKTCLWMLLIPLFAMLINPLFNHNGATVLFVLNNNPITKESAEYGLASGLMIAAVLIWFSSFTEVFTSDKLLYVFGSISPKLALILSMTLRYIPLFKQQIQKTSNAQKAMGLYKENNAIDKVRGGMRIFSVMVTWALENGVITADSMTARGYGTGKRSRFAIFKWIRKDYLLLLISLLLGAFAAFSLIKGFITINWYPYIVMPDTNILSILTYSTFAVLSLIPIYLQIKEELKWKSLQSKI